MNIATRLHRLERERRSSQPMICATCGAGASESEFVVTYEEPAMPDVCPECSRRQVFRIDFDRRG